MRPFKLYLLAGLFIWTHEYQLFLFSLFGFIRKKVKKWLKFVFVKIMTRYARAKGSVAANERQPEEATPWEQMVKGMRPPSNPEEEEHDVGIDDMDEAAEAYEDVGVNEEMGIDEVVGPHEEAEVLGGREEGDTTQAHGGSPQALAEAPNPDEKKKKKRNQDKCLQCKKKGHRKAFCPELSEERRKELQELIQMKVERKGKGTGRKKKKKKDPDLRQMDQKSATKFKKLKPGRVRKDKTGQVVQKGEGLFQGFRVKKVDEDRLKKLQQELKQKGVEGQELEEVLKRERRRAEKELARFNRMVCYNCRQPGHLLADCPLEDKKDKSAAISGQCFKCGSIEHTSRECKASKSKGSDAFAFAVCFICDQKGHLAKACPDNPRGLYPKGGGCRFCGSVEHLKSDCPRKAEKDERQEVRAQTIDDRSLEVESAAAPRKKTRTVQKKKKVIHF